MEAFNVFSSLAAQHQETPTPAAALDYSNVRAVAIPSVPSPRTAWIDEGQRGKSGWKNPEYAPDAKSGSGYLKIDELIAWQRLIATIKDRMESRGITATQDYIDAYLHHYVAEIQDEIDEEKEAEREAERLEFNKHIAKLSLKRAAIFLLYQRDHISHAKIARYFNKSDQTVGNECKAARKYFDSDLFQVDLFPHDLSLDSTTDELIYLLIQLAPLEKSKRGRPRGKRVTPQKTNNNRSIFDFGGGEK